ncbi:hypothetical protein SOCEGT47_013150 [Sorangium cellulosum]|uniref:Phosphodiesterase n=1 Tax=Sorangium cellulosum TaxID=56 RepID=A0A4P2PVU5_SORCE|nr:hypothetical protein [Sorangium cellulosum]AUX20839.1 hypothetical protein SOCEGT47_013150 [Sorangium cellulosum]
MSARLGPKRVLLLEFNEITWTIVEPMLATGKLPTFARLRREGAWASPRSVDLPPHMDPWVTWVTVHTGVERAVHGATVLEQDPSTIKAPRTWDYAVDAGKSVGVFGSISAYPPRAVPGFIVPGTFAPSSATFPRSLEPLQDLNRMQVQVHHRNRRGLSLSGMLSQGIDVLKLGVKPSTCAAIAAQLAREIVEPHQRFRRIAIQPLINYDVFEALYARHRPDYATWHTNHAAHYMHHYWRAMDDSRFTSPCPKDERRKYGDAVEIGYKLCDRLLARAMGLVDDDTILVVASSMGQQPFVNDEYPEGKITLRFKDISSVLRLMGARGVTALTPVMLPQWNVTIPDAVERARVKELWGRAHVVGKTSRSAFITTATGDVLTVTPVCLAEPDPDARYFFPGAPNARPEGYPIHELFAMDTPTTKQGMHHPTGLLMLWGKGIRAGVEIPDTTNLDIAPTLLHLLNIPIPDIMSGRVLSEAWDGSPHRGRVDRMPPERVRAAAQRPAAPAGN